MSLKKPRFPNDCRSCKYLGRWSHVGTYYDLYYCGGVSPTVIARFGENADYYSGLGFRIPALLEAEYRAKQFGFIPAEEVTTK